MHVLEDAALRLEPQVAAHAEAMFSVLSDPAIYEHENQPPVSLEWLRERFARLESRRSPDGTEQWLNWVVHLPAAEAIGYVQATVHGDHHAEIAYVLASRYWGRGLASRAVNLVIRELAGRHGVRTLSGVLKRSNERSRRLLERLGFVPAPDALRARLQVDEDEWLLFREAPMASPGRARP